MRSLLLAAVAAAVLAPVALPAPARAHFVELAADDPINEWLGRQMNQQGGHCCGYADAHIYDGAYSIDADGGVTIVLGGGAIEKVDPGHMLKIPVDQDGKPTDPSPLGAAVWWHNDDSTFTYCFGVGPTT